MRSLFCYIRYMYEDNKAFKQGLICGRFYPYHLGHRFLIQTALEQCKSLLVVVCARREQTIDVEKRAEWIRESFASTDLLDRLQVVCFDQDQAGLADRDPEGWALAIQKVMAQCKISGADAVFANEGYKVRFAELLGAQMVAVDPGRTIHSISATQIRRHPDQYKAFLEPHVLDDLEGQSLAHDRG